MDFKENKHNTKFSEMQQETQDQLLHSEKLALIGVLVAGFAHEIKNPLAAINAYVSALKKQLNLTENYRIGAALDGLNAATDHLNSTVTNFVDFSRKTSGEFAETNMEEVLFNAISISKPHLIDNDIDISQHIKGTLPPIVAIPNQLVQVFLNLIINAVHAIEGKRGQIDITAMSVDNDKYIQVQIVDNGSGMPKEIMDRIFDAFFTTKDLSHGTGLGLSVSYGIIEKHNGYITVDSEQDKGTTFTIKLPTINHPDAVACNE